MSTDSTKLSEVMSTLYGPTATQMMGGAGKKRKTAKRTVKKTKGGATYEELAYPEYISNEDFKKFIYEFYLIKRVCNSYSASLYVIPTSRNLTKMINDFKAILKKNNIKEGSSEAFQYAAINDLPFKACIFSVFADSSPNNYRIDKTVPGPYKEFGTIKRTNLLSEQYYFTYIDQTTIKIAQENTNDSKFTTAKLIAKCLNGIYVFQGDLPEAKEKYENKLNKAFVGGSLKANSLKKFSILKNCLSKHGEQGSELFIGGCVKANDKNISSYAKLFSGDLLHSAFRMCFNDNISDEYEEATTKESRAITKRLMKMYKPTEQNIDTEKYANVFRKLYANNLAKSLSPKQASKEYVNELNRIYNKCGKDMLYADIATNIYRSHNYDNLQDIYNLVENVESVNNDLYADNSEALHLEFSDSSTSVFKTSKLCNYINQSLMIAPLVGINAKTYYPQLQSIDTNKMSYNMHGGYFETVYKIYGGENEGEDEIEAILKGKGSEDGGDGDGEIKDVDEINEEEKPKEESKQEEKKKVEEPKKEEEEKKIEEPKKEEEKKIEEPKKEESAINQINLNEWI